MNTIQHDTTTPAITWLRNEYLAQPGMTKTRAAAELGISHKVLNSLLDGSYAGNMERQLAKLEEQRERLAASHSILPTCYTGEYIRTNVGETVINACNYAKIAHKIHVVYGVSQIGKTTAAKEYRRRYPETTILLELMPKPTISSIVRDLANALRVPTTRQSIADLMQALRAALSPRHLIIIDEAHQALDRQQGADALDVVRRLCDLSGCAAVLIITNLSGEPWDARIKRSPYIGQLDQLLRRGLPERLPSTPSLGDVRAIWEAYGFSEPDPDTTRTICALARRNCFGTIINYIALAAGEARHLDEAVNWDHFNHAIKRIGFQES